MRTGTGDFNTSYTFNVYNQCSYRLSIILSVIIIIVIIIVQHAIVDGERKGALLYDILLSKYLYLATSKT